MFRIKYANVSDAKILGKIHALSWKSAYKGIIPDEILDDITIEKRVKFFERALTEEWEEDAIIYRNNEPMGLICIGKSRDKDVDSSIYGEIWGIYILEEYRHIGIGDRLINWGINELKLRGHKKVSLWVLEENKDAIRFYEKQGFKFDGEIKEIFLGKSLQECRYIKDI